MYNKFVKRLIDILLSVIALVVFSIPMIIFSIIIKATSKGPVLFKQKRVGKNKGTFTIYKFRSMVSETPKDCPTHLLQGANSYITPVGAFMRKTSIDELPQIFCILSSTMSVVGPRPALWNQDDLIQERDKYGANDVKPGLTGWAQINGRDELPIQIKAKLDGVYVKKMGFWFDMKCIFLTVFRVLKSDGVVEGEKSENGGVK